MADSTNASTNINVNPAEVLESIKRFMLVDGFPIVVDLENSHGCRLKDKADGREYLDFFQFFASMPLGFNHPKLMEAGFKEQLLTAAINKPSNSDFYAQQMANFVEAMGRYAIPDRLNNMFLIEGGALAVENALKAAFDWKVQKNFAKGHKGEVGTQVIHFREAFHGRSGYTMSLTNTDPTKVKWFPKFDWPRVTNPKITFPLDDHIDDVIALEDKAKREIEAAIKKHGDDIAALIIEPIQGEGGDNHFRPEFFQYLRQITEENDIIFVLDEIQTGVGLTGKFWAYQHTGITPDVISFGKKMQVCGILASDKINEVDGVFKVPSRINSTWGGNLVDMVRATRYLQVIEEEDLVENARVVGDYLLGRFQELGEKFDGFVSNARGTGLMCAFDLPDGDLRGQFLDKAKENGMLALGCGERTVRLRPPLNMTQAEVDEGVAIAERSLNAVKP
jgi:L-lysine 6-transaminase